MKKIITAIKYGSTTLIATITQNEKVYKYELEVKYRDIFIFILASIITVLIMS